MENGGVEIKERLSPLSSAEISTVDLLAEPAFAPFLRPDFDQAQFANNALAGSRTTAVSQMHILRQGISKLDTALQKEVSAAQDDLLVHTRRLVHSDQSLQSLHLSVESLNAALNRVRAEITEPHQQIRAKAKQLRNLRRIIDILRQLSLHLKLFSKLREQLSQSVGEGSSSVFVDLAKAAKLYSDISAVRAEIDLTGIHALEPQVAFLEDAGRQIRSRAAAGLAQGMQSLSQAEVGGALQVFFNLGELPEAVSGLNSKYCSEINRLAKAALDARQYATGGAASGNLQGVVGALAAKASPAGLGKMQEQLWERLGSLAEQVHGSAAAMWHLQRVLVKKRDPVTHVHFSDVLTQQGAALPLPAFWQAATATLSDSFKAAAKPGRAANVRSTLIQHFPRASVLFLDMLDRLEQDTTVKGVQAAADAQQRQALMAVLVPFQQQFLAGVLSRLNDAVSSTFQGGNRALPSPADVQRCIAAIHDELQHAAASSAVVQQVGMAMGKALQHMVERVEYMAASGPEARALGSSCNPAQERNISLCSHLQELHRSLLSLLPRLPAAAAEVLEAPLASLQAAAVQIAAPLLKAMVDAQEALLLRMHAVNYGAEVPPGNDTSGTTQVSPYVRELAALLESCRSTFLAKFAPPPSPNVPSFISALTQRMASRVLVFSMRHGSLLQRLSPAGKVQLVKDLREIEAAVSANLWPVEVLGQPHKMFRSFLSLLFLDTPSIPATPLLTVLPAEVVLHHLFSRLPAGAQLPYQALSLTPEQYSLWIDSHSHSEAVHGALAALDAAPDELCQLPEWQLVHSVMTAVAGPAS